MRIPFKEIAIYILVTLTLFWTLSFYLLLTTDSDTRLLQIAQMNAAPPSIILYLEKMTYSRKQTYFGLYRIDSKERTGKDGCKHNRKAVLIINAAPIDPGRAYVDFLSSIEKQASNTGAEDHSSYPCNVPQVFILKRNTYLLMASDQHFQRYSQQITDAIRFMTHTMRFKLQILAYHQAAQLTLTAMLSNHRYYTQISEAGDITRLIFVNLISPFGRIQYDPPYKWLENIKRSITANKQKIKMMNQIPLVLVSSHKESSRFQHSYKLILRIQNGSLYQFSNTTHISTRQMNNLRYHLSDIKSLLFSPLSRILAGFLIADLKKNMNVDQVQAYFKHGHALQEKRVKETVVQVCDFIDLEDEETYDLFYKQQQKIWIFNQQCLQISRSQAILDTHALLIYSHNAPFTILSDTRSPLPPYDNLTSSTMYLFQKMPSIIFLMNPHRTDVMVSMQKIATPAFPLNLSEMEVEYMSQVMFTHYLVVRICPNQLLLFPLHFPGGTFRRGFFLDSSSEECFSQRGPIEHFVEDFFLNWTIQRNLIILTLLVSMYLQQPSKNRLIIQFCTNYVLLAETTCSYPLISSVYVLSFSILLEAVIYVIGFICDWLIVTDKKGVYACWTLIGMCIFNEWVGAISTWKLFMTCVLFFLNSASIPVFLLKIYFIFDELRYNVPNSSAMILLLFWVYVNLPYYRLTLEIDKSSQSFQKKLLGILILASAATVDMPGAVLQHFLSIYMRIVVVIRIIKILKS